MAIASSQIAPANPLDQALQGYWNSANAGKFTEAAAKRDELRYLVAKLPADDPQFDSMANNLAQIYANTGMTAQARSILSDALARSGSGHVLLLSSLAQSWEADGNLLLAASSWRQAVAALEAPGASKDHPSGLISGRRWHPAGGAYMQLATLLRRMGKPDEASAVMAKFLARGDQNNRDIMAAQYYEQIGELDQAAAIYRHKVDQAIADPQAPITDATGALQMLANLYNNQQRYSDGVEALQQAASLLSSSNAPDAPNQALWMRQNLANALVQSGQLPAADQMYQQLLTDTPKGPDGQYLQVLTNYAYQLAQTKRGDIAESMLTGYLTGQANPEPNEETMLLYALSNVESQSGHQDRAQAYLKTAQEKQQSMVPQDGPAPILISTDMQQAVSEATRGRTDEALRLAGQAMAQASGAADRDMIGNLVANLANALKDKDEAELLYERLFGLVESWRGQTMLPLLSALQQHVYFLLQRQRTEQLPAALDRYRDALVEAHGPSSESLADVLRQAIQGERGRNDNGKTLALARDLLTLEEALSGDTSQPYLQGLQLTASVYEGNGQRARAVPLRRRAVTVADLAYASRDLQRGQVRIDAALALAREGQFEEAERLAEEAVAIAHQGLPQNADIYASQVLQISQLKASAVRTEVAVVTGGQ
jgi:tetratricopeptide (TPR) repeat protein